MAANVTKSAGYLIGEALLIILSITLAFMANEWREEAGNQRNARQALSYFRVEIERNLDLIEKAIPYHQEVVENFRQLDLSPDDTRPPVRIVMSGDVMPRGINPPLISTSAWETALARNALAHFEFETVYALSNLYSIQESGVQSTWRMMGGLIFNEAMFNVEKTPSVVPMLGLSFQELLSQEIALAAQYRATLKMLDDLGVKDKNSSDTPEAS